MKKLKLTQLTQNEIGKNQLEKIKGGYEEMGCWGSCSDTVGCTVEGDLKRAWRRQVRAGSEV